MGSVITASAKIFRLWLCSRSTHQAIITPIKKTMTIVAAAVCSEIHSGDQSIALIFSHSHGRCPSGYAIHAPAAAKRLPTLPPLL